jgi:hypothetical protein
MVIRIRHKLTEKAIDVINAAFDDVLVGNNVTQDVALPEERNEPDINQLPRLILTPKRKNFGRFRKLIDAVNAAETVT